MADKKKALVVWGGWNGHTPKETGELCNQWLTERGFEVTVSNTLDAYLDKDKLAQLALIVPVWTMGKITGEQFKGLSEAVRSGVGLAGCHGGIIDSFRENTEYQVMTGGQWVSHPGGCIPEYHVAVTDAQHPITRGISDFVLPNTEQYYCHVDPGNHVLCTTTFDGGYGDVTTYRLGTLMPYAWVRTYGKGKVFVASWGHTYKDFDVPQAREIMIRGLIWAAR